MNATLQCLFGCAEFCAGFVERQYPLAAKSPAQGKIAMANLWASRAAAMDNADESQVVGKVTHSAAPTVAGGSTPASTLWWDGIVIAANISDADAENAFIREEQA